MQRNFIVSNFCGPENVDHPALWSVREPPASQGMRLGQRRKSLHAQQGQQRWIEKAKEALLHASICMRPERHAEPLKAMQVIRSSQALRV
jgi:hypothetical protein